MKKIIYFILFSLLVSFFYFSINNTYSLFVKKIDKTGSISTIKSEATFLDGTNFNIKIKKLSGSSNPDQNTTNTTITNIVRADKLTINPTSNNIISSNNSLMPIYAWFSNGTIYYYSEADILYMNADSQNMFYQLINLSDISTVSNWNTSRVTNMFLLFGNCVNISDISAVANWDVSNVTSIEGMFFLNIATHGQYGLGKITDLSPISNWDVSSVEVMSQAFKYQSIEIADLSNWNPTNLRKVNLMFQGNENLEKLDISNFDMKNVSDTSGFIDGNTSLKEFKTPKVYPNDTSITISIPKTMYDNNMVGYSTLGKSTTPTSPTSTWLKEGYTVTFNPDGGTVSPSSKVVRKDETYGNLPTPTKDGYTFRGWTLLPSDFLQLDYILNDAQTPIDTLYYPTSEKIKYEFKFSPYRDGMQGIVGNSSDDDNNFGLSFWGGKFYVGTSRRMLESTFNVGNDYAVEASTNNGVLTTNIDGVVSTSSYENNLYKNSSIGIFSTKTVSGWQLNDNKQNIKYSSMKLYYLKIYDNDVLVRDYIPCIRISDNKKGLYDFVTQEFYTTLENGDLIAGNYYNDFITSSTTMVQNKNHTLYALWEPNNYTVTFDSNGGNSINSMQQVTYNSTYGVLPTPTRNGYTFKGWVSTLESNLPSDYEKIEYIKSNPFRYINTGVKATNNTVVEAKLYTDETGNKNWFGGSAYSSTNYVFNSWNTNAIEYTYGLSSQWSKPSTSYDVVGSDFTVKYGKDSIYINDEKITTLPSDTFTDTRDMYIFVRNQNVSQDYSYLIGKLYYFKIYENDVLIRDFVPVLNKTTYKLGLYDLVNNVFYPNSGSGEFDSNYVTNSTIVSKYTNHTLYAVWEPNAFNVTLNANGGSVSPSTKAVTYSEEYGSFPIPTKTDYSFLGWNTSSDGSGEYIESDTIVDTYETFTLYAIWQDNTSLVAGKTWEFDYNGTEQRFIPPADGIYKLETWGSQGGNSYSNNDNSIGGYGGYSTGNISLNSSDSLYLNVGGKGSDITVEDSSVTGGYNGGGQGGHLTGQYETIWAAGGGATHISKISGQLYELSNYKGTLSTNEDYYISNDIYIVASAGGASGYYIKQNMKANGGSGGGIVGVNGIGGNGGAGFGGTQVEGGSRNNRQNANGTYHGSGQNGSFGKGGSAVTSSGGGAGFFGGGTGHSEGSGAGGGSGYIANPNLTNKSMYCYNCEESSDTNTYTVSTYGTTTHSSERDTTNCPDGYSSNPVSKCAKAGHGYARITLVSLN